MRVLVVSNHVLVGQSLAAMLPSVISSDAIQADQCEHADALRYAREIQPDVIIVEAVVDFNAGIATVHRLSEALPGSRIVVLGSDGDEVSVYEALVSGADGFLTRDASLDTLARTLTGVVNGELGVSRSAALTVVRHLRQAAQRARTQTSTDLSGVLTQREQEVFDLVRQGLRSREISEKLCIAETTVYKHIQNVLDKLQVHSRAQAIIVTALDPATYPQPTLQTRPRSPRRNDSPEAS